MHDGDEDNQCGDRHEPSDQPLFEMVEEFRWLQDLLQTFSRIPDFALLYPGYIFIAKPLGPFPTDVSSVHATGTREFYSRGCHKTRA